MNGLLLTSIFFGTVIAITNPVSSEATNHSLLLKNSDDLQAATKLVDPPNQISKKQRNRNRWREEDEVSALLKAGQNQEAIHHWERYQKTDPHELGLSDKNFAWRLAKAYSRIGKADKGIQLYKKYNHRLDDMTVTERAAIGEEIIFGEIGVRPDEENLTIGHGQCPLCHSFVKGVDQRTGPSLHGIVKRSRALISSPAYLNRPKDTLQSEAFPGSGQGTSVMEYLAESKVCPSCFIVRGNWFQNLYEGTMITQGKSPEPKVHKPPISLTVDEMVAVDTWLFIQEGEEPPSLNDMRAAYRKFLRKGEIGAGTYILVNLAALISSPAYLNRPKDTLQSEAFPGSGQGTSVMEYLAESKVCPSCFIVRGNWFQNLYEGTMITQGKSPEPKVHKPPISLTVDEMVAVDTWLFIQEGEEPPSLNDMRAAYRKFLRKGEIGAGTYILVNLAALYDAQNDLNTARGLLEEAYPHLTEPNQGALTTMERFYLNLAPGANRWRDVRELFRNLKHDPETVSKYPLILQEPKSPSPGNPPLPNGQGASTLAVAYGQIITRGEFPRWSPDGTKILFTDCRDGDCSIWEAHPDLKEPYRTRILEANGAYGDWSPDGKAIIFLKDQHEIWLKTLDDRNSTFLTHLPTHAKTKPIWDPQGTGILVLEEEVETGHCLKATYNIETKKWNREQADFLAEIRFRQGLTGEDYNIIEATNHNTCQPQQGSTNPSSTTFTNFIWNQQMSDIFAISGPPSKKIPIPYANILSHQGLIWAVSPNETFATLLVRFGKNPVLLARQE